MFTFTHAEVSDVDSAHPEGNDSSSQSRSLSSSWKYESKKEWIIQESTIPIQESTKQKFNKK